MWTFKKKTSPQEEAPKSFTSVICIPGTWSSWDEFLVTLVKETHGEYLAAGKVIMNAKNEKHWIIDFCEPDKRMKVSFATAGKVTRVTEEFLDRVDKHKYVIYISGTTGNLEEAMHIVFAANAILNAGGIGIKIETAGKAFEKEKWNELCDNFEESNLYQMFVLDSILKEDGTVFSCGMQNLGMKDTIVSGEGFQDAVNLISIFGYYQIVDKPTIQNRNTFSKDMQSPKYRIIDESNQPYEGHEQFGNPFGMWRLTREDAL